MISGLNKILNDFILFLLSIFLVIIIGTSFDRFLPNWGILVSDVGRDGAWFVSAINHLIYGVFIALGLALSVFVARLFSKHINIITVILTSTASIMIFDYGLVLIGANTLDFFTLMILLVVLSFTLNIIFAIMLNKKESGNI